MNKVIIGAAALCMLSACGQDPATEAETAAPLGSGIDVTYIDESVRPGDDFFAYVNGKWAEETEMPSDRSRYGTFDILRDEAQEHVKVIIELSATGDFAKGSDEQKVGDLYKSYLDMERRNARGIEPLKPEFERIASISSYEDLAAYFSGANRRGYNVPLRTSLGGGNRGSFILGGGAFYGDSGASG